MSVNQLLEKALSTSSEEEAIACLRMARKRKVGSTDVKVESTKSDDFWKKSAVEWNKAALGWKGLYDTSNEMYKMAEREAHQLKIKCAKLESKASHWFWIAVGSFVGSFITIPILKAIGVY